MASALVRLATALLAASTLACGGPPAELVSQPSKLWGENGELWDPAGRLPDFSHAGYHAGEDPLPTPPNKVDVTDFGAVGDGVTDDSEAFLDALEAVSGGAVFIPNGRYLITRPLRIDKSHVVLRGESRDSTVLFFPKSLKEVLGRGRDGGPTGWSWGGAWIWVNGEPERGDSNAPVWDEGERLATVMATAPKGQSWVEVDDASSLEAGQLVRLVQFESDGSLSLALHANQKIGGGRCSVSRPGHQLINWVVEVKRVEGGRVHFDRPLRIEARAEWGAALHEARPLVEEVGIEQLTIDFPVLPYPGHHNERGFNAISLAAAYNSWVRDVAILNFDNGILFWYSRYCTAQDIVVGGRGGHYAFNMGGAQDSLLTRFRFETRSLHDTSNANLGNGNVMSWGKGIEINFDHHRGAAYQNLYSRIDVGRPTRMWKSSATPSGHYTAGHETFWNILPRAWTKTQTTFPAVNLIGPVKMSPERSDSSWFDLWVEPIPKLSPPDLHSAQLARRLGVELPKRPAIPRPLPEEAAPSPAEPVEESG